MSAQGRQSGFGTEEKAQGYTEGNIKANKEKTPFVKSKCTKKQK